MHMSEVAGFFPWLSSFYSNVASSYRRHRIQATSFPFCLISISSDHSHSLSLSPLNLFFFRVAVDESRRFPYLRAEVFRDIVFNALLLSLVRIIGRIYTVSAVSTTPDTANRQTPENELVSPGINGLQHR